ncbi:MAG: hypothetical protein SVW77_02480 [Candidatus Nanohaloarchaea archaeon]|nr:hypothetical protein [Candidatus Nanohaloarchaea archaeon]
MNSSTSDIHRNHHYNFWIATAGVKQFLAEHGGEYDVYRETYGPGEPQPVSADYRTIHQWIDQLEAASGGSASWSGLLEERRGEVRATFTQAYDLAGEAHMLVTIEREGFPDSYPELKDAVTGYEVKTA